MATNFEFYKDDIQKCLSENNIAIKNNKPVKCVGDCNSCIRDSGIGICMDKPLFEWLYAEHIEPPKLTKRERAFCEAVQTGWIARDGKYLYWHIVQPMKDGKAFVFPNSEYGVPMVIKTKGLTFDVVKNKEMMAVEDLLKLDVMEEETANNKKCSSYHVDNITPYCSGTKECDPCSCEGDESKCDFYPENRKNVQEDA